MGFELFFIGSNSSINMYANHDVWWPDCRFIGPFCVAARFP